MFELVSLRSIVEEIRPGQGGEIPGWAPLAREVGLIMRQCLPRVGVCKGTSRGARQRWAVENGGGDWTEGFLRSGVVQVNKSNLILIKAV